MKLRTKIASLFSSAVIALVSVTSINAFAATDPNGDGKLDISDAIFINQCLNGIYAPTNYDKLDYDGNGVVSSMDSYKIQQALLVGNVNTTDVTAETEFDPFLGMTYFVYDAQTGIRDAYRGYSPTYPSEYPNNEVSPCNMVDGIDDRMPEPTKNGVVKITNRDYYSNRQLTFTGVVVAPHIIATAAQSVYNNSENDFTAPAYKNTQITLYNKNGVEDKTVNAVETHLPYKYIYGTGSNEYDYALLTVSEDLSDYMQFDFGVALKSASRNEIAVSLTGFPVEVAGKKVDSIYTSSGNLINEDRYAFKRQFVATNFSSIGDVGSPIYVTESFNGKTNYTIIGIMSGGTLPGYSGSCIVGTRITPELLKFYKQNPVASW